MPAFANYAIGALPEIFGIDTVILIEAALT
jgi:hypothetical protein